MSKRILVVDESPGLLQLFEEVLRDEGYDVVLSLATYGNLGAIERMEPDLIILDHMFGRNATGWAMLEALKAHPPTRNIPMIICTTASMAAEHIEPYLVRHNVELLKKPFDVSELVELVAVGVDKERDAGKVLLAPLLAPAGA